jgi:membrane protein YdbS with pleckstrin-like domain
MAEAELFPRNVPFKPSEALVTWFIADFLLLLAFIVVVCILPMASAGAVDGYVAIAIFGLLVLATGLFFTWTRLYYESMFYELHTDELRWRRGVWFRTTGIVPYNRITNLDLRQGPVMRRLNISSIAVQTAGYSGQGTPEIRIEAIEHAEELRELLRKAVHACNSGSGDATGTGRQDAAPAAAEQPIAPMTTSILMLDELRRIRQLLEQQKK